MVFAHLWNAGKPSTTVFVYFWNAGRATTAVFAHLWNAGRTSTVVFACSCEFPRFSPQNGKSESIPSERKHCGSPKRPANKKDAHGDIVFAVRVLICENCSFLKKTSLLYPPPQFSGRASLFVQFVQAVTCLSCLHYSRTHPACQGRDKNAAVLRPLRACTAPAHSGVFRVKRAFTTKSWRFIDFFQKKAEISQIFSKKIKKMLKFFRRPSENKFEEL